MDKPLDSPVFQPLFEKMNEYSLPIQMHPRTMLGGTRYLDEASVPKDIIGFCALTPYNWPFETTIAMGRLVFSGIYERYPSLKALTHHMGGFVPFHTERTTYFMQGSEMRFGVDMMPKGSFTKNWAEYYKMSYSDTAWYGATRTLMGGMIFSGRTTSSSGRTFPLTVWEERG